MSRKSMAARERQLINKRNPDNQRARAELVAILKNPKIDLDTKISAMKKLQKRRIDESKSRSRNRCVACNRSRGVLRFFGLCRLCLVHYAAKGWLPGIRKSSW